MRQCTFEKPDPDDKPSFWDKVSDIVDKVIDPPPLIPKSTGKTDYD